MKLLEKLCLTPGVSGREHRIRSLIETETQGLFDEVHTDAMGSLHAIIHPKPRKKSPGKENGGPKKIMLAAHMDQIGFIVRHVDSQGFVRISNVGGFDTRNLFARNVLVCTKDGDLPGVMNPMGKPIHLASEEEKKKIPEINDFVIDLGLPADDVKKQVKVGDMVVLAAPVVRMGRSVASQCLDNRAACWIAIKAIEQLKHHQAEIHCVFTVQEEVGLRGATTAAFAVKPDIAIALDTTLAVDTPGVPEDQRVTAFGGGAGLSMMDGHTIGDLDLVLEMESVANDHKIKTQRCVQGRGGTDAGAMQRAASGAKAMTISLPTRYIHTVTEMIHLDDLHACRDLVTAYLESH